MLRIDRVGKTLKPLTRRGIPDSGLKERDDIQAMIRRSPDAFFAEMGENLLLIGEEVRPTEVVDDRIDLLALDPQGTTVIIEIKRSSHKLQLLQALAYAAMVSKWGRERVFEARSRLASKSRDDAEDEIEQFIVTDLGAVNDSQRVILIAESFDWEVLATSEWLTEKHDVDVRCYRIALSVDSEAEFLSCTCIYPPPELTEEAIKRRGATGSRPPKWADWEAALADLENRAVTRFFLDEVARGRENYLRKRILHYRVDGKRVVFLGARRKAAYAWQYRRFPGDLTYWLEQLGPECNVGPIKGGAGLRFFLREEKDFIAFRDAAENYLPTVQFVDSGDEFGDDPT